MFPSPSYRFFILLAPLPLDTVNIWLYLYLPSSIRFFLDTMESRCYASYSNNVCSQTLFRPLTISQCCCGKDNTAENRRAWGNPCMACPVPQTGEILLVVEQTSKLSNWFNSLRTKYLSAILHPPTQFYILFSVENYRKVCVHGSGKDSGGKGRLLDHSEGTCSKLGWF